MVDEVPLKSITLHVGLEKTGTTALQVFLNLNRTLLQQRLGIFVCPEGSAKNSIDAHHSFAKALISNKDIASHIQPLDRSAIRIWIEEFCSSSCPYAVISSELFAYASQQDVQSLANLFSGISANVLIYLRPQDDYLEAQYAQHLKGIYGLRRQPISPADFVSDNMNFLEFCDRWSGTFGVDNTGVVLYGIPRTVDHIYSSLLKQVIGQEADMSGFAFPEKTVNPSLTPTHARLLMALASNVSDAKRCALIAKWIVGHSELVSQESPPYRQKQLIPRERKREMLELYRESNSKVAIKYLRRSDGLLFPQEGAVERPSAPQTNAADEPAVLLALLDYIAGFWSEKMQ